MAIVKAMLATDTYPDFIVVDGAEGGTGAAPLEFSDSLGTPLVEGLMLVQNTLVGAGVRHRMKIGASGKLVSASAMARAMALGADWCNSARGFMFAVGCIQSQRCHTNRCPVGRHHPGRASCSGRSSCPTRRSGSTSFHSNTVHALAEMVAAMGLDHPSQLCPELMVKRVTESYVQTFAEIYPHYELNVPHRRHRPGALPGAVGHRRRRPTCLAAHHAPDPPKQDRRWASTVAEILVDQMVEAGIRKVYGIVGDSANPIVDALRRHEADIEFIHVRNEEAGAFAAGADAQISGRPTAVLGSSGPGSVHLLNGLYDCQRNGASVFAIATHIPSAEIGTGYFQETARRSSSRTAATTSARSARPPRCRASPSWRSRRPSSAAASGMVILPGDIAAAEVPSTS